MRGRRGIGLLRPLDLGSTPEIRSTGERASTRRHERLTGGARQAARTRERLTGGARRAARAREWLTGRAGRAARARAADRRGPIDRKAGCGGSDPGPLDLRRTARVGLGLFKTEPFDLR
jgi:hypothetical protein